MISGWEAASATVLLPRPVHRSETAGSTSRSQAASAIASLSVGSVGQRCLTRDDLRFLPPFVKRHPRRHGDHKDDDAGRQRRETLQRRPRAKADKAPSNTEQRGTRDQRHVDLRFARPEILFGQPWL